IAVGAVDVGNTVSRGDDRVAGFSSNGGGGAARNPDLLAPGQAIRSLRVPGSLLDERYPVRAGADPRLINGSGTSQAAAVVSGAAALVVGQRPDATPDQVKALLLASAAPLPKVSDDAQAAGEL